MARCTAVNHGLQRCRLAEGHAGQHKRWSSKGSPVVNFRVPQDVLDGAKARATDDGTKLNAAVVAFLRRYGAKHR